MVAVPSEPEIWSQNMHEAPRRAEPTPRFRYEVETLWRGPDAGRRSLLASRELVRLAAELDPASAIAIDLSSGVHPGRVDVGIELFGPAATAVSPQELSLALGMAVSLGDGAAEDAGSVPLLTTAFEQRPLETSPMFVDE